MHVDDESDDESDSGHSLVDQDSEEEEARQHETKRKKTFKVDGCHVHMLQLYKCRSKGSCSCVADPRIPETIFYRRNPRYEAEVIKGCASMYSYRFLPNLKYVVEIRQYACETCPACKATRAHDVRYEDCIHLQTVRATSYKCSGYKRALAADRCQRTGLVPFTSLTHSLTHLSSHSLTPLTHPTHFPWSYP